MSDYGVGIGWRTNWRQSVSLNNDGMAALGSEGGFGAASAIVAIQATSDLASNPDDPQHLLAETATQQWFVNQTINNTAVVANGLDADETFLRRQDGTFLKAQPDGSLLVQSGQPTDSLINRRLYNGLTFTYTGADGSQRAYDYPIVSSLQVDYSQPGVLGALSHKLFPMATWTFTNGIVLTTTYRPNSTGGGFYLSGWTPGLDPREFTSVTSSLGPSIRGSVTYGFYGYTCVNKQAVFQSSPFFATFSNSTQASVKYALTPYTEQFVGDCMKNLGDGGGQAPPIYQGMRPLVNSFTDQLGHTWNYSYSGVTSNYDDTAGYPLDGTPGGQLVRLASIYKPSAPAPATPAAAIAFGLNGQVRTITDALGNVHTYYASPFFTQLTDPLGASSQTSYDEYGRAVSSIDPLGRTTTSQYDFRDRVTLTTNPGLDTVARTYDIRSNLTSVTKTAAPGSPLSPLSTQYAYVELPNVLPCANLVVCNRLASATDPLNNTTNYSWDPVTGNLTKLLKPAVFSPADNAQVQPETDFFYTQLGGAYLLTSKKDFISANVATTTAYGYNASNKYTLSTVTADSGGLGLRTCFKFDTAGNLVSTSDPRATSCPQ
jgi:YD repeat-containing protein